MKKKLFYIDQLARLSAVIASFILKPTTAFLLSISYQAVLHFMTGYTSTEEGAAVSQDVVKVLVLSGLMKWFVLN